MADYAAVYAQPVAQALLTIDAAGNPQIAGRGFSDVTRDPATGGFLLTFDQGTGVADVGSGPDFTVGIIGPNGLDPACARVAMTMRGGTTAPGTTTINSLTATVVPGTPGMGGTQLSVVTSIIDTPNDPMGHGVPNANGGGLEIMVWNGCGPENAAPAALVGPLFQGAMQFP